MKASSKSKSIVLVVSSLSLLMVGLDATAVNVALPAIGHDLGGGVAGLQWTVEAYTLVVAALLLLAGSLADRLGRRRTLLAGLGLFSSASLACSVAPTVGLLVGFRAVQAVGGAMLNPVAMAIIANTFTEPRERAHAIGIRGAMFGVSMALGPLLGGLLTGSVGWRAIFLINVPLGLVAIALTQSFVPESRAENPRRLDPIGQVLMTLLLGTLTYGLIEAPRSGWSSPAGLLVFAAAPAALIVLLVYERRRREPLIDPRLFRSVPFSSAIATTVAAYASFGGFLFLTTLYLQRARELAPLEAGAVLAPMAVMTVITSPISGRILARRGPRIPLAIAGTGILAGCLSLTGVQAHSPVALLVLATVVFGTGFGFVNAPVTDAAVSGMPRAQAGVASAIATTSRMLGQSLGVAVAGAILGSPHSTAGLVAASRPAWWTLAGGGIAVVLLSVIATTPQARESARRTAAMVEVEAEVQRSIA
jgi:EmrB/QacA subfamily drug resistance transporter